MPLNIQLQNKGFGSYLTGIVPDDIALAAGAFSATMSQIKNINDIPIEKLAQVASNMETATKNLSAVNGSNVPTNAALSHSGLPIIAKGNGPQNTYTMSNFLGCMSGLPYNNDYAIIKNNITNIETSEMYRIYREEYLAVTWAGGTGHLTVTTYNVETQSYVPGEPIPPATTMPPYLPGTHVPRVDDWYYVITGIVLDNPGGGYGREGAPAPLVTISPNTALASFSSTIDTSDANVPGTFGRITSLNVISLGNPVKYTTTSVYDYSPPATPTPPALAVYIECPPTTMSGTNTPAGTAGWSGMNSIVQNYIDQANAEILRIQAANPTQAAKLNTSWNNTGIQLNFEQRARTIGLPNLPPQFSSANAEPGLAAYPSTQYIFVDSLPNYGLNTEPHMYAQTIEAISNFNTTGGQSMVALQRESRNQARLNVVGIRLDNNIPTNLSKVEQSQLISNGVLPNGDDVTPPASLVITDSTDQPVTPQPIGIYNPVTGQYEVNGASAATGAAVVPGSLGQSPYGNVIAPTLNTLYTSNTLIPSVYSVQQAIDEVIRCNCECWAIV